MPYGKKPFTKSKKSVSKAIKKSSTAIVKAIKEADTSVLKMNWGKILIHHFKKSCTLDAFTYAASSGVLAGTFLFDPSNTTTGSVFPAINTDWANLVGLYLQYKVNRINVSFEMKDTASGSGTNAYIFLNKTADYGGPVTTLALLAQRQNVVKKTFTVESPTYKFSFVPKMAVPIFNGTATTTTAHKLVNMGWVDTDSPVLLYGLDYYSGGTDSTQTFFVNVEYDMSFKYQV